MSSQSEMLKWFAVLSLLLLSYVLFIAPTPKSPLQFDDDDDDSKLTVHLIAHTHDDAGWQVSVDEYQMSQVDVILDNVLSQLEENTERRFTYAEVGFFANWFRRASAVS